MLILAVIVELAQTDPPRTVNGQPIGTAAEFRRHGPARICLESTRIILHRGETSELDYLGIHVGKITIKTLDGDLHVSEGDAWAAPKRSERAFETDGGFIERVGRGRSARYLIFSPSDYSDKPTGRVWVEGSALRGNDRDRTILDRIEVTLKPPMECDQRFTYGWDALLGEPKD